MTAIAAVIAAACGAALGVLFTVAHRATAPLLGFDFPYGIVLGIAAAVAFLIAMRLLWETRWPSVGGTIGLLGAIAVLSFGGTGGSVLVSADAIGWAWLIAPTFCAAIVIAWPRRSIRGRSDAPTPSERGDTMDWPELPVEER